MKHLNISEATHRTFANRFLKWGLLLKEAVVNSASVHVINSGEWRIKFVDGHDEHGDYLEFYAIHPSQADTHFKIYDNGTEMELPALTDGYDCNPSIPGQCEIERGNFVEQNKLVYESLKKAGLDM